MAHNIFALINHKDKDIDEGEAYFTLIKNKQRSAGFQFKSFDIHYTQDSGQRETYWDTERAMKRTGEDLDDKQIRIIKRLLRGQSSQKEIAEYIGCTSGYITQVKNKAKDFGYLTGDGKGTKLWEELYERFINREEEDD